MTPEKSLWQAVVYKALLDATFPIEEHSRNSDQAKAAHDAHNWLTLANRDFKFVCANAGLDPDFISEKYKSGLVTYQALKSAEVDA